MVKKKRKLIKEIKKEIEFARESMNDHSDMMGFTSNETKYTTISGYIEGLKWVLGDANLLHSLFEKRVMEQEGNQIFKEVCDYQGKEFGAEFYPDSVCCDGYLYDADSFDGEGYTIPQPDEVKIPCPKCNSKKYKQYVSENSHNNQQNKPSEVKGNSSQS